MNYAWINNKNPNIVWLCKEVKNRLHLQCQFIQNWNADDFSSSKCLNYRFLKRILIQKTM